MMAGAEALSTQRRPYDDKGRFVPLACALCACGQLRHQGQGFWSCDGLLDPQASDKKLEPCPACHQDGEAVENLGPAQASHDKASCGGPMYCVTCQDERQR